MKRTGTNEPVSELSSCRKVERRLTKHLRTLSERGSDVIPVTSFKRILNNGGRLPEGVADKGQIV